MSDDETERRLRAMPEPDLTDPENPEWTENDFARAIPPSALPPEVLAALPGARSAGRPRSENPKRHITLRLSPEVIDHFRATGPGWQGRIDRALVDIVRSSSTL